MKTKEELNKLKEEIKEINEKLKELTPEELQDVAGGILLTTESTRINSDRGGLDGWEWWDV